MAFEARHRLDSILKPDMTVFEWGSGGSTIYLASKVKKVVSVEHHQEWYDIVSKILNDRGIDNVEYKLIEPEPNVTDAQVENADACISSVAEYSSMNFERYVRYAEQFPDQQFDVVIVDGRVRLNCLQHAISKVRAGGYLVLDDSERERYSSAFSLLGKYPYENTYGLKAYIAACAQTTFWQIGRE